MGKIRKILCSLLAAFSLFTCVPQVHAAPGSVNMWSMADAQKENANFISGFTDSFGYSYRDAVCFDVVLGSTAVYTLSGQYSQFTGTLTTSQNTDANAAFDFAVALDGKVVYSKTDFTRQSKPEEFTLDLTGAQTMQILTGTNHDRYTFLYVADGSFTRAEEAVQPDAPVPHTLQDVVLVTGDSYGTRELVKDTFGNLHCNNSLFGDYFNGSAVYNLDGKYDTFTASIFAETEFGHNLSSALSIYCDGKRVKHYEKIDRETKAIEIEIDVRNVTVLKIESIFTASSVWSGYKGYLVIGDTRLSPHVHIQGELKEDVAPTCTEDGRKSYTCTVCGEACGIETPPALGHTPGDWETGCESTCTQPGQRVKHCLVCGAEVETETIAALGHTPGDWETSRESTCSQPGQRVKYCLVCGAEAEAEEIEALPHTPGEDWVCLTEASCSASGAEGLLCLVCGEPAETRELPQTKHQMGSWVRCSGSIWSAPIHSVRTCTVCGQTEERFVMFFAWFIPLVLTVLLLPLLAAGMFLVTVFRMPGVKWNRKNALEVLREALALKGEDATAMIRDLREAMSDPPGETEQ